MIAKILPQAESYYHQTNNLLEKDKKKTEIIDKLQVAVAQTDEREVKYLDQLKVKDQIIEDTKPKWWQQPWVITGEVVIAFIIGILVGG